MKMKKNSNLNVRCAVNLFLAAFIFLGSSEAVLGQQPAATLSPNFIVIIADDVGVEQFKSYGIGSDPAHTPTLDELAREGISFSHVWSNPLCSPSRGTLLSGRYAFRTGLGFPPRPSPSQGGGLALPDPESVPGYVAEFREPPGVNEFFSQFYINDDRPNPGSVGLPLSEIPIASLLAESDKQYSTAAIGKWHIARGDNGWLDHPELAGFEHYSVLMGNAPESYFSWRENVNGVLEARTGYTPERKIDDTLEWISAQDGESPWFMWLALNLPHYPHHVPPVAGLDVSGVQPDQPHAALDVMIARMDYEIGRLLAGIAPEVLENTIILFIADNGTTGEAIDPPFHPDKGKFTLYEGGIRVPLIISGLGIPHNFISDALVSITDIYATIAALAGVPLPQDRILDSVSLTPYFSNPQLPSLRSYNYSDVFFSDRGIEEGAFAFRDQRYKLIRWHDRQELYDLLEDPYESNDLLADGISEKEMAIVNELSAKVDNLRGQ